MQTTWEEMQSTLDVHVRGAFHCSQAAIPGMIEQKSGRIINIGSSFSLNTPPVNWSNFLVAKSAMQALTRCLAAELGPARHSRQHGFAGAGGDGIHRRSLRTSSQSAGDADAAAPPCIPRRNRGCGGRAVHQRGRFCHRSGNSRLRRLADVGGFSLMAHSKELREQVESCLAEGRWAAGARCAWAISGAKKAGPPPRITSCPATKR